MRETTNNNDQGNPEGTGVPAYLEDIKAGLHSKGLAKNTFPRFFNRLVEKLQTPRHDRSKCKKRLRDIEKEVEFLLDLPQLKGVTIWRDESGEWCFTPNPEA